MAFYTIKVLDKEGYELANYECEGLAASKSAARDSLSEREYLEAGANKVEVLDQKGECVFDLYVP